MREVGRYYRGSRGARGGAVKPGLDQPIENLVEALLVPLVRVMVDNPDEVSIETQSGQSSIMVEIFANPTDRRFVLGREGKTIDAMRTIFNSIAARGGYRCTLNLVED